MSLWFAAFLGLVQGAAEFLPVSSSGHLALLQAFFGVEAPEESRVLFDVLLHLGTLVSVCAVYGKDLMALPGAIPARGESASKRPARRLALLLLIATLPLAAGVLLKGALEALYLSPPFIGVALLCTGALLYISDRFPPGRKTEGEATPGDALTVGLMQVFALLPGISRSGSTITAGLLRGFDRRFAVRFSFLLSIPAILGANLLKLGEALSRGVDTELLLPCAVGGAVAAVTGFFAIRLVGRLAEKGSLRCFSWYCWAIGLSAIITSIVT